MKSKKNCKKDQKIKLVFTAFLSRLTDFQLASKDDEFFDIGEEIREGLVELEEKIIKGEKAQQELV